jgi:hypothetical protein
MNILIGADPELFVKDAAGNLISAWNMIPGTKKNPHKVEKGAVQVDGMALEFNIDPAINEEMFIENINHVMKQMKGMIPHEFFISPVAYFGMEYLQAQPEEALELGCDPDFNGWTMEPNPRPDGDRPFRTASGHVHVGWDDMRDVHNPRYFFEAGAVARQLDFYLGLPSLLVDADKTRRELYGKAGAFRVKPYGMEYRVLSNFWLTNPKLQGWVYRASKRAVEDMFSKDFFLPDMEGDIQDIINNSDIDGALSIIDHYSLEVPRVR